jgi:hypothetical protein
MTDQQFNFFSNSLPELLNDWDEPVSYSSETSYHTTTDSIIYWEISEDRLVGWF